MFMNYYVNGNISNAFDTVNDAIEWGKMTSDEFTVIDTDGLIVFHYVESEADHGFVNVGGMSYDAVRRMGRE